MEEQCQPESAIPPSRRVGPHPLQSQLVGRGASIKANQVFAPYGNARAVQGTLNTFKGFTGQYNDALTGLDYYISRYYDPVVGVFLSADSVEGNAQGMDPYTYVGGNSETHTDSTEQMFVPDPGGGGGSGSGNGGYGSPPVDDWWNDPSGDSVLTVLPAVHLSHFPAISDMTTGLTSCGVSETQVTCRDIRAHYAFYLSIGGDSRSWSPLYWWLLAWW